MTGSVSRRWTGRRVQSGECARLEEELAKMPEGGPGLCGSRDLFLYECEGRALAG